MRTLILLVSVLWATQARAAQLCNHHWWVAVNNGWRQLDKAERDANLRACIKKTTFVLNSRRSQIDKYSAVTERWYAYRESGQTALAMADLKTWTKLGGLSQVDNSPLGRDQTLKHLVELYEKAGDFEGAIATYDEVLSRSQDNPGFVHFARTELDRLGAMTGQRPQKPFKSEAVMVNPQLAPRITIPTPAPPRAAALPRANCPPSGSRVLDVDMLARELASAYSAGGNGRMILSGLELSETQHYFEAATVVCALAHLKEVAKLHGAHADATYIATLLTQYERTGSHPTAVAVAEPAATTSSEIEDEIHALKSKLRQAEGDPGLQHYYRIEIARLENLVREKPAPAHVPAQSSSPQAAPQTSTAAIQPAPAPALPQANSPASLGRRVALVVGNANYGGVPRLTNAANDARAVAARLRELGFAEVDEHYDLSLDGMAKAFKAFGDTAADSDWAVVYYAGHGIEVNGAPYLVPTDAKLLRDTHVTDEAFPLDRLIAKVEGARQLKLVILDACRSNPFMARIQRAAGSTRSIGRGLSRVEPEGSLLIAYSAKHGTEAQDGTGTNSPFAESLLTYLGEPNLEVQFLFRKVRDDVMRKTGRAQEPYLYGSLGSEAFYFRK